MKRRIMYLEVSYESEDSVISVSQTKKEIEEEKKKVVSYLKELIDYDYHQTHKLKIKEFKFKT